VQYYVLDFLEIIKGPENPKRHWNFHAVPKKVGSSTLHLRAV